ncbi:MAG: Mth938-like domain-containing protein [Alphaproteobacteria bacterium]|nr:Mth938-like domain-containing protein [Alphaproteobacteria bacterium]
MDITPLVKSGQQIIQSYAGGRFRVSGQLYESAIIVQPSSTQIWTVRDVSLEALTSDDFAPLIAEAASIDVLLLGCGAKMRFLPLALRAALKAGGLSVDIMDTGAACRTYNVLMAEGRRVAAALLPV